MTNRNPFIRPAMTAIAAVLACSTPSFAQSADPAVTETPVPAPATGATPPPIVPDAPAPDPVAADPIVAEPVAVEAAPTRPAARRATTTRAAPARTRAAPTRTATAASAAAPAAAAVAPPVAETPVVEPLPVAPEAAPVAAPAEIADASSMDGIIPALVAGGLIILALAGAALLLRRRKRHAAEADELAMRDSQLDAIDEAEPAMIVEPEPVQVQPAFVAAPALATTAAPVVAAPASDDTPDVDGPVTELPEDFDLSRFGYNVQQAYKGPTEDNPSLSLRNRLTRARGMDQLERNLDAEVEAATGEPVLTEAELTPPAETAETAETTAENAEIAETGVADPAKREFLLARPGTAPAMRPAYPK